ncbi:uncharacterized protein L199_008075 [Kwoniella botswanensis]|uniref:uncharacterized protein n=1 Tax=Kwoniella botswanensis TaxID=1268659 RepID=UPI00315C5C62
MDPNDQQQPSQTPDDDRSGYHPLPNLAEDHITFVDLRREQDLPGIWEKLDDILTEHNNNYSHSTPQSVTNTTPFNLRRANAQIQKLTRVVELQATIIADMNQAMRQIQNSLQMYQGGSMSSRQGLSWDNTNALVDSKVRAILADYKMHSNMEDKKRKRKRKEKEVVVLKDPKDPNSSRSTPHIVGASSGSPIKTAKKGGSAPLRAKKAGSPCPIELVHRFGEDQGLDH